MGVIRLARLEDAGAIHEIYAPIVRETVVSFETEVPTVEEIASRIERTLVRYPWLVWVEAGRLLGYAYGSTFRRRAAYRWSTEVSAYVHPSARRRGIGRDLYEALFVRLAQQGYHNAYAGIALPNPASVALHEAVGFEYVGRHPRAGFKLGGWHDLGWWARALREDSGAPGALRGVEG